MSTSCSAGAAQFAAVGYVASGLRLAGRRPADGAAQRPPPALLGRPRPWLRDVPFVAPRRDGPPADRRGVRAVDRPLPAARADRRVGLLDRRRSSRTFIPWNLATARRRGPRRPDPGPGPVRHRHHLPGGDDRPRGRADHRSARARRGHRRGGRRRGRRLLSSPAIGIVVGGLVGPASGCSCPGPWPGRPHRSARSHRRTDLVMPGAP